MPAKLLVPFVLAGAAGALVASLLPLVLDSGHAESRLLPFQGRLTDAAGSAVPDGARVVEFKLYDAPTGGSVKWAGEVHKLSVNGGLVNTMLGSKASLGTVDFSTPTYLQITIDANSDNQITIADPPLLPRQSVVPSVFAVVAGEIQYNKGGSFASVKGSDLFNASGKINAPAIAADNAITAAQLATNSVESAEIKDGTILAADIAPGAVNQLIGDNAISSNHIKDGEVKTPDIAPGAVSFDKLARLTSSTSAPSGGLAVKLIPSIDEEQGLTTTNNATIDYPDSAVTLQTNGGPVMVGLIAGQVGINATAAINPAAYYSIFRGETRVAYTAVFTDSPLPRIPMSLIQVDTPPPGTHTYRVRFSTQANRPGKTWLHDCKLFAIEMR